VTVRTVERKRHHIGHTTLVLLKPVVRYSYTRDAFVLRGVGQRVGPVLKEKAHDTDRPRRFAR
jgi:hypothetical protein